MAARHLYVHVPFCAHRCGYCDFVTVTGREHLHEAYVDALVAELARRREAGALAAEPETVFVGGGTPTLLGAALLGRLLDALPAAPERTVECNPETVDAALAEVLAGRGVRVSLGAQSFQAPLLAVLERRASPETVRGAVSTLRAAGVENLSLDVLFGIPGETPEALDADLDELLALAPEHCSLYELEAKPGTRFTHAHGAALARQAELLEGHYEQAITRMEAAGYAWYETANFCRPGREARHNLAYWHGRDYLGIGVGAVSTLGPERLVNTPRLEPYVDAVRRGEPAPARCEPLDARTRVAERLILGLRLAEGVAAADVAGAVDDDELERLAALGLCAAPDGRILLTRRGRLLANDVIARLLRP
jgi:oxygen-independent coproporphyrinogen-3 oxidase